MFDKKRLDAFNVQVQDGWTYEDFLHAANWESQVIAMLHPAWQVWSVPTMIRSLHSGQVGIEEVKFALLHGKALSFQKIKKERFIKIVFVLE